MAHIPITKIRGSQLIPIILIMILLFISVACANMLIPSYGVIKEYFNIDDSLVAIPDAFFVLVSAFFALLWGYYTDKINRSKVIMAGAFAWTIGMILTGTSEFYEVLIFSRILSGFGLGCVLPVGYSIISDIIPPDERSGWFGTLAILSSVSNGIGQGLSSFLGPLNIWGFGWKFPFILLSIISIIVTFILFFVEFPHRGASEAELLDLSQYELEYVYKISKSELTQILQKKTNKYLIIQGFFAIIPGTIIVYFLISMLSESFFNVLPASIRIQTATIFGGLVGLGYILGNMLLSGLSDTLFRRNRKNRVRLAIICMVATVPLCLISFFMLSPLNSEFVDSLNIPDPIPIEQTGQYIFIVVGAIFANYPSYIIFFIFALIGSTFSAGPIANRTAVMVDVNLPEHKGTTASLFRLSEQVGKGMTLLISYTLITLLGSIFNMMIIAILFWIPGAICWSLSLKSVIKDMDEKSKMLSERKQTSLIDYIFELEIQIDRALQKVHDLKFYFTSNKKKFLSLLNDAIEIFSFCETRGESRSITNIENKAHILKLKAILLKQDYKKLQKELSKEDISQERRKKLEIDKNQLMVSLDEWEISSLGKLKTLYDDGYLWIYEARLKRKYDLFKTLLDVKRAIAIYNRVELLLKERIEGYNIQETELSEEDKKYLETIELLHDKSQKAKDATEKLENNLNQILSELNKLGISQKEFKKISAITGEYEADIEQIILDTMQAHKGKQKIVKKLLNKIGLIFDEYDNLREVDYQIF